MIFCVSDLHGCFDEFMELLKKINFSNNDKMYILGDNIDRGPKPIEILKYIYEHDNIISLYGNHELSLVEYIKGNISENSYQEKLWFVNGGVRTLNAIKQLQKDDSILYKNIADDLLKWSYYCVIDNFILSHAGYNCMKIIRPYELENLDRMTPEDFVYSRNEFFKKRAIDNYITIFGHTPTQLIRGVFSQPKSNDIWMHKNDKIGIDGGLFFKGGQLNCLCLETMDVIVVKNNK